MCPKRCIPSLRDGALAAVNPGVDTGIFRHRMDARLNGPRTAASKDQKLRHELPNRPRAMTENCFHGRSQFAERTMALDDLKERIIPKTATAYGVKENSPAADAFAFGPQIALRIRERGIACIVGCATFERHASQLFDQKLVVPLIGRLWARKPGRIDAGGPAKCINRQAAIFTQHPLS